MGFRISTLNNLPSNHEFYYILIGEYYIDDRINNFFRNDFFTIADSIGESAIVQSTRKKNLEQEIYRSMERVFFDSKHKLNYLYQAFESDLPGLLILDCHPADVTDESLFLYVSFLKLGEIYPSNNELLRDLIDLANKRNDHFVEKLTSKKGFLHRLYDAAILEPNFVGFGVNLKKLL